jgi:hypothetical protein
MYEGCVESETANQGIYHHPSVLEQDVNVSHHLWLRAIRELKQDGLLSGKAVRDLRASFLTP